MRPVPRGMACRLLGAWAFALSGLVLPGCLRAGGEAQEAPPLVEAEASWNDDAIAWATYEQGMSRAAAERRPIVLVFYTDWCPHCHNFSRVFHTPEVVALARSFVMIRVERDGNRELSEMYDLDGEYIPRTFFLTSAGEVRTELHGKNPSFRYFVDEHEAHELVALMRRALAP
jgi:thiol:disulfide interchange protein